MLLYLLSWAGFVFIAGFTTLCLGQSAGCARPGEDAC